MQESNENINIDESVHFNDINQSGYYSFIDRLTTFKYALRNLQRNICNYKIWNITLLHWILLFLWVSILIYFTSIYRTFYNRNKLFATMCTNILLFGLSDLLAQSISCFFMTPIDPIPQFIDNANSHFIHNMLYQHISENMDNDIESDDYSIFNDYGITPVTSYNTNISTESNNIFNIEDTLRNEANSTIFSIWRWICFMGWGAFISNFQVPWYKILNFFFTTDPTLIQIFERVLCDQLVYSPVFLFLFFTYSNYVMEGGNDNTLRIKIQKIYLSTLGCNLIVWPIAQIINFSIIPKHLQVPFSSSVGVLWNCFLSMRNSSNSI